MATQEEESQRYGTAIPVAKRNKCCSRRISNNNDIFKTFQEELVKFTPSVERRGGADRGPAGNGGLSELEAEFVLVLLISPIVSSSYTSLGSLKGDGLGFLIVVTDRRREWTTPCILGSVDFLTALTTRLPALMVDDEGESDSEVEIDEDVMSSGGKIS